MKVHGWTVLAAMKVQNGWRISREWYESGQLKYESWRNPKGWQSDGPDGTAAYREWSVQGWLRHEHHYKDGHETDLADGTPARRMWYEGHLVYEEHAKGGTPINLPDGTLAIRSWNLDGTLLKARSYIKGKQQDLPDGTAAYRVWHTPTQLAEEGHYKKGNLHDPPDGTPAWRCFSTDGTAFDVRHYKNGELIE